MRWFSIAVLIVSIAACAALAQTAPARPGLADANAVCAAVAEGRATFLPVARHYAGEPAAWSSIDIDNDGNADDVAILTAGSSHTPWLAVRTGEGHADDVESQYEDGDQTFAPSGGALELVEHGGRVYKAFYSDAVGRDYPTYVAINLPGGESRWLCRFAAEGPEPHLAPVADRAKQPRSAATANTSISPWPTAPPPIL